MYTEQLWLPNDKFNFILSKHEETILGEMRGRKMKYNYYNVLFAKADNKEK